MHKVQTRLQRVCMCVYRAETHISNDHLPESCVWVEGILSKFVLRPGSIESGHLLIRSVSLEFADFFISNFGVTEGALKSVQLRGDSK